jgi:hypothetical protein
VEVLRRFVRWRTSSAPKNGKSGQVGKTPAAPTVEAPDKRVWHDDVNERRRALQARLSVQTAAPAPGRGYSAPGSARLLGAARAPRSGHPRHGSWRGRGSRRLRRPGVRGRRGVSVYGTGGTSIPRSGRPSERGTRMTGDGPQNGPVAARGGRVVRFLGRPGVFPRIGGAPRPRAVPSHRTLHAEPSHSTVHAGTVHLARPRSFQPSAQSIQPIHPQDETVQPNPCVQRMGQMKTFYFPLPTRAPMI